MIKYKIQITEMETELPDNMNDYYYQEITVNQNQLVRLLLELAKIREEEK